MGYGLLLPVTAVLGKGSRADQRPSVQQGLLLARLFSQHARQDERAGGSSRSNRAPPPPV
jgi:hypothetical protein